MNFNGTAMKYTQNQNFNERENIKNNDDMERKISLKSFFS